MIWKPIDKIEAGDISDLVANAVCESRTLEYKQELPGGSDDAKKEFLADVSSFANASGGDILFGVSEKRDENGKSTGEPEEAVGVNVTNLDAELLKLDSVIRDGIEPSLPGIRFEIIPGFTNGPVIVLRIPESWLLPHMVTLKGSSRFFSRSSAGKYPLDVSNLRSLFAQSEGRAREIQRFRDARLSKVVAGEAPIPLDNGVTVMLHLHPASPTQCDVVQNEEWAYDRLRLMNGRWNELRFNIDGLLVHSNLANPIATRGYLQLFRNGAIESVISGCAETGEDKTLDAGSIEYKVLHAASRYVAAQQDLGISSPMVLMLSLLGTDGFVIRVPNMWDFGDETANRHVDRDLLILPDVVLQPGDEVDVVLRPVFDALWQSAGWPKSRDYNKDGRHVTM